MGVSKSKSKSETTPIVQEPMKSNLNNYAGSVANYAASDAYQYVSPASDLQKLAFDMAPNLGGWEAPAQQAVSMAQNAGSAGPSTYQAPTLGPAAQAQGVNVAAAPQAQAQSLLTGLNSYMNPYTNDVVNTTLANYDRQTGAQEAQLMARKAATGGSDPFGGSRLGVQLGEFTSSNMLNRAMTEAGLRSNAFNTGAALSGQDADRRQGANFFNIGNTQARNLAQAGFDWNRSMFNTDAQNQFALTQGGMDDAAARYNAQAQEAAYQRALHAAGLTANIGSDMGAQSRADLALTADIGSLQRDIEQARLNAPVTQLMNTGTMYGYIPPVSYVGQNVIGKESPSLFGMLLQAGNKAASAMAAGAA